MQFEARAVAERSRKQRDQRKSPATTHPSAQPNSRELNAQPWSLNLQTIVRQPIRIIVWFARLGKKTPRNAVSPEDERTTRSLLSSDLAGVVVPKPGSTQIDG